MGKKNTLISDQYKSESNNFVFKGLKWPVQGKGGLNTRNLRRIFQQTDVMFCKFSRICLVRFDLHPVDHSPTNQGMQVFRRRLFKRINSKYGIPACDITYCWCREHERAKNQHYHWFLIFDGKKIRSCVPKAGIGELIIDVYDKMNGSVHLAGYHNIKRNEHDQQQRALSHLSYLAKIRGKGYAGQNVKNFASSKTPYPDREIGVTSKGLFSG